MTHVWHAMIPHVPESVAAVADVRRFIERVGFRYNAGIDDGQP